MLKYSILFTFAFLSLWSGLFADTLYVSTEGSCSITCDGSVSAPFDNLLDALQQASLSTSPGVIVLLYDASSSSYVLDDKSGGGSIISLEFTDLTIKALLCDDALVSSNSALKDRCLESPGKLRVSIKTTGFSLLIEGSASLENIIFDAEKDVKKWSTIYPSTNDYSSYYNGLSAPIEDSLFVFSNPNGASKPFNVINVEFLNFQSPHIQSLILLESSDYSLAFDRVKIDSVYFDSGVIVHSPKVGSGESTIIITESTLQNYNPWDMYCFVHSRNEGYFLNSKASFKGTFKVTGSNFTKVTSSLRNSCWAQTKNYYNSPMNNLLTSDPRSRSDLWSLYKSEINTNSDYISSLIYLKSFQGDLEITGSTFSNIIGTSGSVLRVDDITSSGTTFSIDRSSFDQNFAYYRFANIMIAKKSGASLSSMLDCPKLDIENSKFTSTCGCPGSYGNIFYLCPWDSSSNPPKAALSSYSLGSNSAAITSAWSTVTSGGAYVKVTDSTFENNLIAISNSLAVVGAYSVYFEGNTFQKNGGTTADIALQSLENSYFAERYPDAVGLIQSPWIHFGQSSSVYLDRFVAFSSNNDIFRGNWGSWEGSLSLASSLTVKNWIKLSNKHFVISGSKFLDHQGIPVEYELSQTNNVYMEPIVSISVDYIGSSRFSSLSSTLNKDNPITVTLENVKFLNNIVSYDYASYNYNLDELGAFIYGIFPQSSQYQTGLLKMIWTSQAIDDTSLGFLADSQRTSVTYLKGEISNNEVLSMGCFFSYISAVSDVRILENKIYVASEVFIESPAFSVEFQAYIWAQNQGIFCIPTADWTAASAGTQLTASNLVFQKNQGILFNAYAPGHSRLYLSDSVFVENSCLKLSMITIREFGEARTTNNIFINNKNSVGIFLFFFEAPMTNLYNVYLGNSGLFAALYFLESAFTFIPMEGLAKLYWNTVYGDYKLVNSGMITRYSLISISYSTFLMFGCTLKENYSYGGAFISVHASVIMKNCLIADHSIVGATVLGINMAVSSLDLENVVFRNNTLIKDPSAPNLQTGFIIFLTANFRAKNVTMIDGNLQNGAFLFFGNLVIGTVSNVTISNIYNSEAKGTALMHFTFSTVTFEDIDISNTTGIWSLSGSKITMNEISVRNLRALYENHFLINMFSTVLKINDFRYEGNGELGTLFVLIGGDSNSVWLNKMHFMDALADQNSIFELTSSDVLYVTDSVFEYSWDLGNSTLFNLDTGQNVVIQNSVFRSTGTVLKALGIEKGVYFLQNNILTCSNLENIVLTNINSTYILGNTLSSLNSLEAFEYHPHAQLVITDSYTETEIVNNVFLGLSGTDGIVQINAKEYAYDVNIEDNIFMLNSASRGGALFLSANQEDGGIVQKAIVKNCLFALNKASISSNKTGAGKGGAIYQTTSEEIQQDLRIRNSVFLGNIAEVYGGAIFFDYSLPDIDSLSIFRENSADGRENHIGSYPVMLELILEGDSFKDASTYNPGTSGGTAKLNFINQGIEVKKMKNLASGMKTSQKYNFVLIDIFNQTIYSDNSSTLEIYPKGFSESLRELFTETLSMTGEKGMYTLENFTFNYRAGEKLNVTLASTAIPNFKNKPVPRLTIQPSVVMEADFRLCGEGEFQSVKNNLIICKDCPLSYWQVDPMTYATSCTLCDPASTICRGGNNVGPKNGYWRYNSTASVVVECQRKESCIGNNETQQEGSTMLDPVGTCAEHYRGNACAGCERGWARNNNSECIQCQTNALAYILFFAIMILQSLWIAYGIRQTIQESDILDTKDHNKINDAALLRIFTNFAQIFVLIMSIPINWPNLLGDSLSTGSKISSFDSAVLSTDCFFLMLAETFDIRPVFIKTLVVPMLPVIYVVGGLIFWVIRFLWKKKSLKDPEFSHSFITTMVIICYNIQPDVIQTCFSIFQCQNLYRDDYPVLFLVDDYDVKCWEGEHLHWVLGFALPCLLLWTVVLPGLVFWQLRKNKEDLKAPDVWKKYCFIYNGYRDEKYYWELILMTAKVVLISVIVFSAFSSVNLQIYASLTLILVLFAAHSVNIPYQNAKLNHIENGSLMSLGALSLLGIYFQIFEGTFVINILAMILGVASFLYFFTYFLGFYFSLQFAKLKENEKFMKVITYLDNKVFCCFKYIREMNTHKAERAAKKQAPRKLVTKEFKALQAIELSSDKMLKSVGELTIGSPISNQGQPGENERLQLGITNFQSMDILSNKTEPDPLELADVSDDSVGSEAEASPVKRPINSGSGRFNDHVLAISSQRTGLLVDKANQQNKN